MVVYVVSGASYGVGLELVRQISSDSRNQVFAIVNSARSAERLAKLTSVRGNIQVYFDAEDRQAGFEVIARDISKLVGSVDVLINNVAWVGDCLGTRDLLSSCHPGDQMNDLQQFFSTHVLGTINITNAFLPLLRRGELKKVVIITSEEAINCHTLFPSGMDIGVAYAMAKIALNMAVLRYSALPELRQDRIVCAHVECDVMNASKDLDDLSSITQTVSKEVLGAISQLGLEDSGRYIRLREEQDLITL